MKRDWFMIMVVVVLAIFALVICIGSLNRHGTEPETRLVVMGVAAGINSYRSEYGTLPTGDATAVARVVSALNGDNQNPKRINFVPIEIKLLRFNKQGTWVDEWGEQILLLGNDPTNMVLRSYGKNRRDDDGAPDDISFPTFYETRNN